MTMAFFSVFRKTLWSLEWHAAVEELEQAAGHCVMPAGHKEIMTNLIKIIYIFTKTVLSSGWKVKRGATFSRLLA